MPAGMPEPRQGIHLAQKRHRRLPSAEGELRPECGAHPRDPAFDPESAIRKKGGEDFGRSRLAQRKFGEPGDLPKDPFRLGTERSGNTKEFCPVPVHYSVVAEK